MSARTKPKTLSFNSASNPSIGVNAAPSRRLDRWPLPRRPATIEPVNDVVGLVTTRTGKQVLVAIACEHWAPEGVCRHGCPVRAVA